MSKEVQDIVRVADVVQKILSKLAAEGVIEAAAVKVVNLSWVMDMQGRESWALTLGNVEPNTVDVLFPKLIHEFELVGLGWDDWDLFAEWPDENGSSSQEA